MVATPPLGHFDHQVFVEISSETIGRGGDAALRRLSTKCSDAVGIRDLTNIGVAVGEQDDTCQRRLVSSRQQPVGTGLPATVQIR